MFSERIESIIKDKSIETYAFLRILRRELPDFIPSTLPLISLSTSSEEFIKVYKNIQFDVGEVKRKIWFNNDTFKPTVKGLEGYLQYTTEDKHLGVNNTLKLTSFISKYLDISNSTLKDHQIRDISNSIMHSLHDNLANLVECNSPKDHVTLYEVHALSCMSPKQTSYQEYNTNLKTFLYKKHKLWPSMWYHYNPHTKGIFLRMGKRGVARTILLRQNVKGKFNCYYRNIYAESFFYKDKFKLMLENNEGLSSRIQTISITNVFKVPAILLFSIPICPLPFHDCVNYEYYCYFNKTEKVFYFGPKDSLPSTAKCVGSSYAYNGYIDANIAAAHRTIPQRELI